ncbi:hypothetical protein AWC38_SpisGene13721 [Stylophora pistillata]|uniref:Uncharacterized protein n=1 Tax=Stylophora pistillata TaxID=50429 RepID=A0A2B4RY93_STYPI|nr:hypothetical protein AWC38_SpisGene13721 [Stylophora pistillata]
MYKLSTLLVGVFIAVSVLLLTCPRDTEAAAPWPYKGKRSQVVRDKKSICQTARALGCDKEENWRRQDLEADEI